MLRRHLPSAGRVALALALGLSVAILGLVTFEAATRYPSPDGYQTKDGQLLGGDFVAFYTGGDLFSSSPEQLYDIDVQREYREDAFGQAIDGSIGELPFVYPPLVAALLSLFSSLEFEHAFYAWTAVGLTISLLSLLALARATGVTEAIALPWLVLLILGFVPFTLQMVFGGQASWIGVAILAWTTSALLGGRDHLAGALMSLTYYKPPLFLFLLVVLLFSRRRNFTVGFALGAAFLVSATLLVVGFDGVGRYLDLASRYVYGRELAEGIQLPPDQGMGLWALGVTLLSSVVSTAAVLAIPIAYTGRVTYRLLSSAGERHRQFGLILGTTATLAFSLQLIRYDLAMLVVPMLLAVAWAKDAPRQSWWVFIPFAGFFLEFLLRGVTVDNKGYNASSILFVLILCTLLWQGRQLVQHPSSAGDGEPAAR